MERLSKHTPTNTSQFYTFSSKNTWASVIVLLALSFSSFFVQATHVPAINITGTEQGARLENKFLLWYDASNKVSIETIDRKLDQQLFVKLDSMGSTGLKPGAIWSWFKLRNTQPHPVTLHLEYVDHQLIGLTGFQRDSRQDNFIKIADLALNRPFIERQFPHHRFVFEVIIPPEQTSEFLVKYASDGMGFVFPNLRLWQPNALRAAQTVETSGFAFLIGGFFLMAIFALAGGIASGERIFYAYCVYSLSKIGVWATVLGYTHQFVVTDSFHWSYMSLSGAITIFCGLFFARMFLQTKLYLPRIDAILLFMMANAVFLLVCAVFKLTTFSVISITLALLLYPVTCIAGLMRWYQGSREAAVFALAWGFLVAGLFIQALRDLGFVEHNFFNYYWPPLASFTEVVVIMVAMGLRIKRIHRQKDEAELKYTMQLERSKAELEDLVLERTRDLLKAKSKAEQEARTDALTGTHNRRSFFDEAERLLNEAKREEKSFTLLMFDIDKFKSINDTYGHNIGDEALKAFAQTIQKKIREQDVLGRLGGEEFSLLVCDTDENACLLADRLREEVSRIEIETPIGALRFTTSVGVAHLRKDAVIDELMSHADRALYKAKKKGRNQVIVSDLLMQPSQTG